MTDKKEIVFFILYKNTYYCLQSLMTSLLTVVLLFTLILSSLKKNSVHDLYFLVHKSGKSFFHRWVFLFTLVLPHLYLLFPVSLSIKSKQVLVQSSFFLGHRQSDTEIERRFCYQLVPSKILKKDIWSAWLLCLGEMHFTLNSLVSVSKTPLSRIPQFINWSSTDGVFFLKRCVSFQYFEWWGTRLFCCTKVIFLA